VLECELDSLFSGQGPAADCCEHGNEHLGPIRNEDFFLLTSELSVSKGHYSMELCVYLRNSISSKKVSSRIFIAPIPVIFI
jgi:hypothetical protein